MPGSSIVASCRSLAHPSLALVKYWGKSDVPYNVPATPSLAITLDSLYTETEVSLHSAGAEDSLEINGKYQDMARFVPFLNEFRRLAENAGRGRFALEIKSRSNFASAAGLASSSSGFAALAVACCGAVELNLENSELSALARLGSASASRSLWGGFTRLDAGAHHAEPVYPVSWWPELRVIVLQVDSRAKNVSSRQAMEISRKTSPFYTAWLKDAPKIMKEALQALEQRNLMSLGPLLRESYLRMFSTMFSARPPIIYWKPESLMLVKLCEKLRAEGVCVWETMDAGPQVKFFCEAGNEKAILNEVHALLPRLKFHVCRAGEGAKIVC